MVLMDNSHHTSTEYTSTQASEESGNPAARPVPSTKKFTPERTCIVTRKAFPQNELLRFVIDPDNQVVADLTGKLPGRGMYIHFDRIILQTAIQKNAFAKAAKQNVKISPALMGNIEKQYKRLTLDILNMARRAGDLIISAEKIEAFCKKNKLGVYITASEKNADNYKTLSRLAAPAPIIRTFDNETLSETLALPNAMHLGLKPGPLCNKFLKFHKNLIHISQPKED